MEIIVNFPLARDFPFSRAIFSTSGVGSTPGKRTKNNGVAGPDSEASSLIFKTYYST